MHGISATAAKSARYLWRTCFNLQNPFVARRRALGLELYKQHGGLVQAGPLRGFHMSDNPAWGVADRGCMLVGFYEANVLALLEDFSAEASTLVDIGAADGYYGVGTVAVGMYSRSVCFEQDPVTREVLAGAARLNGVADKVTILGSAGSSLVLDMQNAGVDLTQSVVLCDIEGGEFNLFDDKLFQTLSQCRIIIELHERMLSDGEERLARLIALAERRFTVTFLEGGGRDPGQEPLLQSMPDDDRWLMCSEGRMVHQQWMVLVPIQKANVD